jgi:hypothetical protein
MAKSTPSETEAKAPFEARCSAVVTHNGIVKLLLTVESSPGSQDEHMLFNLLKSRIDFEQGDIVEVTFRKSPK